MYELSTICALTVGEDVTSARSVHQIKYRCATGFAWSPQPGQPIPEGFNAATNMFELTCQSDGFFKVS